MNLSAELLFTTVGGYLHEAALALAGVNWSWEGNSAELAALDLNQLRATVSALDAQLFDHQLSVSAALEAERDLLATSLVGAL